MNLIPIKIIASCVVGGLLTTSAADAGMLYSATASARFTAGSLDESNLDQSSPTSAAVLYKDLLTTVDANAFSGEDGVLGGTAQAGGVTLGPNNGGTAQAYAQYRIDDLKFSSDEHIESVLASMAQTLSGGGLAASAGVDEFGRATGMASVSVSGQIIDPERGTLLDYSGLSRMTLFTPPTTLTTENFGVFQGIDVTTGTPQTFFSPKVDLPLNTPLVMIMSIRLTGNFTIGSPAGVASGVSAYSNTLTFPTDGPAFDLPPGVTVNSAQLNIVNNRWLGSSSTAVPEPSSSLGFLAITMLGVARLRSTRNGMANPKIGR